MIKLGGSVITNKNSPYVANPRHIRALARIIRQINVPLVVAHGTGSFGHTSAAKYGGMHGYKNSLGIAKVSQDALEINSIVMRCFIEEKVPAIALRPSAFLVADKGVLSAQFLAPVELILKQGLVPVIYGDVIWDKSWESTIFSGETTLSYLATYFLQQGVAIKNIIELSATKGVLDTNGQTIVEVTPQNWKTVKQLFFVSNTVDVTGGMQHKVEQALILAQNAIATRIIDGNDLSQVAHVLLKNGTAGTLVHS